MMFKIDNEGRPYIIHDGIEIDLDSFQEMYRAALSSKNQLKIRYDSSISDYQKLSAKHNELRTTFNEQNTCLGGHEENIVSLERVNKALMVKNKRNDGRLSRQYHEIVQLKTELHEIKVANKVVDLMGSRDKEITRLKGSLQSVLSENETLRATIKKVSEKLLLQAVDLNVRESQLKEARKISITKQNIIDNQGERIGDLHNTINKLGRENIGFKKEIRALKGSQDDMINPKLAARVLELVNSVALRDATVVDLKKTVTNQATELHSMRKKCRGIKNLDVNSLKVHVFNLQKRLESTTNELMKRSEQLSGSRKSVKRFDTVIESLSTSNMELEHKLREMTKSANGWRARAYQEMHSHKPKEQSTDEFKHAFDKGEMDISILAIIEIDNTKEQNK